MTSRTAVVEVFTDLLAVVATSENVDDEPRKRLYIELDEQIAGKTSSAC